MAQSTHLEDSAIEVKYERGKLRDLISSNTVAPVNISGAPATRRRRRVKRANAVETKQQEELDARVAAEVAEARLAAQRRSANAQAA